jgi:hypothetical protein
MGNYSMSGIAKNTSKLAVLVVCCISILSLPTEAKSRYGHQSSPATQTTKLIDDSWAELVNNWGYDYTLDPSEFGQGIYGIDGFDGSGYDYGEYF